MLHNKVVGTSYYYYFHFAKVKKLYRYSGWDTKIQPETNKGAACLLICHASVQLSQSKQV